MNSTHRIDSTPQTQQPPIDLITERKNLKDKVKELQKILTEDFVGYFEGDLKKFDIAYAQMEDAERALEAFDRAHRN